MRRLNKRDKVKRPREPITAATFGKELAKHHREMLRKMFPKRAG